MAFISSRFNKKPQISPLRYPGFPVEIGGAGKFHAAFLDESRTRGRVQCGEAGNPVRSGRDDNSS
jgi:hypothetical protein